MTLEQLREALQDCNLSKLARLSSTHVRTLRRIKYGRTDDILAGTINRIKPHLAAAKRSTT